MCIGYGFNSVARFPIVCCLLLYIWVDESVSPLTVTDISKTKTKVLASMIKTIACQPEARSRNNTEMYSDVDYQRRPKHDFDWRCVKLGSIGTLNLTNSRNYCINYCSSYVSKDRDWGIRPVMLSSTLKTARHWPQFKSRPREKSSDTSCDRGVGTECTSTLLINSIRNCAQDSKTYSI